MARKRGLLRPIESPRQSSAKFASSSFNPPQTVDPQRSSGLTRSSDLIAILPYGSPLRPRYRLCQLVRHTSCNAAPAAHNGHSRAVHIVLGSAARLSSAKSLLAAHSAAAAPSTTSAPIATGVAPQSVNAANVPRTADPAFTTSFTIATRLFRSTLRKTLGIRYPTGNSASSGGWKNRSE